MLEFDKYIDLEDVFFCYCLCSSCVSLRLLWAEGGVKIYYVPKEKHSEGCKRFKVMGKFNKDIDLQDVFLLLFVFILFLFMLLVSG